MSELAELHSTVVGSKKALAALSDGNGGLVPKASAFRTLAKAGLPTIVPLFHAYSSRDFVGLRVAPGTSPRTWAAVHVDDDTMTAQTICDHASVLVPAWLVSYARDQDEEELARTIDTCLPLHLALGGDEKVLRAMLEVSDRSDERSQLQVLATHTPAGEAHAALMLQLLDAQDDSTKRLVGDVDFEQLGSWRGRALSVLVQNDYCIESEAQERYLPSAELYRALERGLGIDTGERSFAPSIGAIFPEGVVDQCVAMLEGRDYEPTDPIEAGLYRMCREDRDGYDRGVTHCEALVAFDERGELARAWECFQTAAFLGRGSEGEVPDSFLAATKVFADNHADADLAWLATQQKK